MPFGPEFFAHASRAVEVKSLDGDFQTVRGFIEKAVANAAKLSGMFAAHDVQIYMHGSYANKTNIYFPSEIEICVELKNTIEFDGMKSEKAEKTQTADYVVKNNYFVDIALEFGPKQFRELILEELTKIVGTRCFERDKTIHFPTIANIKHEISVMPCFSFKYFDEAGESFNGVLLYDSNADSNIVTFPRLHTENGRAKDIACGGNFKKCVRFFKTLNYLNVKEFDLLEEKTATGYFIECLLYNVPNNLFRGDHMQDVFSKVMNFLLNCEFEPFVCQNLVWHLFGIAREFWQIKRAEKFLASVFTLWNVFPVGRTFIA